MGELILVRHGQASFGTDDYDRLSAQGFEQGRLLGRYLRERGLGFDRVIRGSLRRHQETLAAMEVPGAPEVLPALNEFDFYAVVNCYLRQHPDHPAIDFANVRDFFLTLRKAVPLWSEGGLVEPPEPWSVFESRIKAVLAELIASEGRVLVVSSGGPISALLREVLQLSVRTMFDLNLQCANTSLTRLQFKNGKARLQSFNGVPHLDHADASHLITLT